MAFKIRLSPSGPEMGDPGALVGSSAVAGRIWGKSGVGASAQVPGTDAGDVPGSTATVDLQSLASGYQYDVEAEANTFGTGGGGKVILLGSTDAGATYPVVIAESADFFFGGGVVRVHHWGVTFAAPINSVKMQLQRDVAASAGLTYVPVDCTWRIHEISPTS